MCVLVAGSHAGLRKSRGSRSSGKSKKGKGERKRSSTKSRKSRGNRKQGPSKSDINDSKEKGKMVEKTQLAEGETYPKPRGSCVQEATPGPGDYSAPTLVGSIGHDPTRKRDPAFSFTVGCRNRKKREESVPGPKYNCGEMTRFGPSSITGPILLGKPKPVGEKYPGPGPGHYSPELYENPRFRNPPRAHLLGRNGGDRIDPYKPSPGEYNVPSSIGDSHPTFISTPGAAILGRSWDKPNKIPWHVSPGPNQYDWNNDAFMKKGPSARILGRSSGKTVAREIGPGPNAYLSEYVETASSPSYSFGIKHAPCVASLRGESEF